MRILMIVLAIVVAATISRAHAITLDVDPQSMAYAYKVTRDRNMSDVLIQNIWIINEENETVTLQSGSIRVLSGDQVLAEYPVAASAFRRRAAQIRQLSDAGFLDLYDFQFRTRERLAAGVVLSESEALAPGEALLYFHQYLSLPAAPDAVVISITGASETGVVIESEIRIDVAPVEPQTDYIFPLQGTWFVGAGPDARSHHRWNVASEFAMDIIKLGAEGLSRDGPIDRNASYFAYGAPVRAVADGVVTATRDDIAEDESMLRRPDESFTAHEARIRDKQNQLIMEDAEAVAGNYVIIQHKDGKYSQYAHLRPGSIEVKAGEVVRQGQSIGELGNSGNSTEPHLHFQMTHGPIFVYARGAPVTFVGIEGLWENLDGEPLLTGDVVIAD